MDVGGYTHNYEGSFTKSTYQMSINRERTTTTQGVHASLVGILSLLLKSFEEEIHDGYYVAYKPITLSYILLCSLK